MAQIGFKCGMAVLVGRAGAGKTSLLNALVGRKVGIVTPAPLTTRHVLHGVIHRPDGQIVLVDTPGILREGAERSSKRLERETRVEAAEADVLVHVVDPSRAPSASDAEVEALLAASRRPSILVLGKADLDDRPHLGAWRAKGAAYRAVVEASAVGGAGLRLLVETVFGLLPDGPPLYPADRADNLTTDLLVEETIREKAWLGGAGEARYRAGVVVERIEEDAGPTGGASIRVRALLVAPDDECRTALLGPSGAGLAEIRDAAVAELHAALDRSVSLDLELDPGRGRSRE